MIGSHSRKPSSQPARVLWYVLLVLCVPWVPGGVTAEDNPLVAAEQQLRDIKKELEQGVTDGERYEAI